MSKKDPIAKADKAAAKAAKAEAKAAKSADKAGKAEARAVKKKEKKETRDIDESTLVESVIPSKRKAEETKEKKKKKQEKKEIEESVGAVSSSADSPPSKDKDIPEKETLIVVEDQHIDSYRQSATEHVSKNEVAENLRLVNLGLVQSTLECLQARNVKALFPIQAAAYKPVVEGKDLLARARTGTGKTLAFSLPMVDCLKRLKYENSTSFTKRGRGPKALIMAPTRELALQVSKELTQLCANELSTACFYGGTMYDDQMRILSEGVDIAIGTPGRLIDHIERKSLSLQSIRFVCLDEADQMLDIGFAEDMDKIINLVIEQRGAHDHQTLLFSATMPDWIKNAVRNYMKPDRITLDLIGNSKQKTSATVSHFKLPSRWQNRAQILGDVAAVYGNGNNGRTIIFVETKNEANELVMNEKLVSMGAQVLHGDISQNQREKTMQGYRDGKFSCLITTNVCARGVDIPEVDLVINAEPPQDVESYIHRSGRTGRAGRSGSCVTFYKADQEYLVENIKKRAGVDFSKISAPQPAEIVSAIAGQTIQEIEQINPAVFKYFEKASQNLLAHFEGNSIKALSACFSIICGTTKPLQSRSLITANEGWVTLYFQTDREMRNIGYVKSIFTAHSHPTLDIFKDMTGWRLAKDSKGVVVDVNEEKIEVDDVGNISIAGINWKNGKGIKCFVCTELPELQASYGSINQSSRGRGGGFRGGGFRGGSRGGSFGAPRGGGYRGGRLY